VRPVALLVHPEVEIVEGRPPEAGREEIMVGALAATRLGVPDERLSIGRTLHFDHRDWTIVGRFRAPNAVMDAEIWLPLTDLQIATKHESSLSCGHAGPGNLHGCGPLRQEPARPRDRRPPRTGLLPIHRGVLPPDPDHDHGTRPAIVLSLSEESVFTAACGAILGALAGLVLLDGLAIRFSMGAFAITVDAPVMLAGLTGGLFVGLVGAVPPAARCLRLPIVEALKSH
jgi:hypothetical protein